MTTRRTLFVATILLGSFLLFMVQPLVARLALPRLGGAPAVWNSAMLVYQALLLGGYAYAHAMSRLPVRRQAIIHLALLALAALTLPIALANLAPPAAGWEPLWVPALLALTIGPVFFLVSAQAPLMQRWFAADREAGDPYWLYAASNLGSFAGLLSYPLVFEPALSLAGQSLFWSFGYGVLFVLVALAAWSRWRSEAETVHATASLQEIGWRRILLWLALAAVPSGLMLSTTTHLTTDIFAMPLLWVVPLGLYLLSFVLAFNERSVMGVALARTAPSILLLAGGMAMVSQTSGSLSIALAMVAMLFVVAVALHRRLYALRPAPERLTFFYLIMSLGGVIGGAFTALVAPVVFDWVWEHPLLVLAAAALLPERPLVPWLERFVPAHHHRVVRLVLVAIAIGLSAVLALALRMGDDALVLIVYVAIAFIGLLVLGARWALLVVLLFLMLARGGYDTLATSIQSLRDRSYFGIYTVSRDEEDGLRVLTHGTTLHGHQRMTPGEAREPTSYYGRSSGVGLALEAAPALFGQNARIGAVGLGAGTLACYRQPGQDWHFFEIDPTVLDYSRDGTFTFLADCTPDAKVHIGDARLELEDVPDASFDLLIIDAFSSDSIPLHLLTREAMDTYDRVLAQDGLIAMHISNRYIDLRPVLGAHAGERGWLALLRDDPAGVDNSTTGSLWVVFSRNEKQLIALLRDDPRYDWYQLTEAADSTWTDNHASVLPHLIWNNILGGN